MHDVNDFLIALALKVALRAISRADYLASAVEKEAQEKRRKTFIALPVPACAKAARPSEMSNS